MRRTRLTSLFSVVMLVVGVLPAAAQSLTLKVTDIKGSSVIEADAIDLLSFGWAVANGATLTSDGPITSRPIPTEVAVNLQSFDALPQILQKVAAGAHVDKATLKVWDASQKLMYFFEFEDIVFGALSLNGQIGNPPFHSLTFTFSNLKLTVPGAAPTLVDFTTYKIK
jgi:hypothetical protein